mmetsp:Transcript_4200/g.12041  ORF Transcript_4200/g.12041 Transcript_4200/m.12041 type:complete len:202 (-) Transcript_4200:524-1129(-)
MLATEESSTTDITGGVVRAYSIPFRFPIWCCSLLYDTMHINRWILSWNETGTNASAFAVAAAAEEDCHSFRWLCVHARTWQQGRWPRSILSPPTVAEHSIPLTQHGSIPSSHRNESLVAHPNGNIVVIPRVELVDLPHCKGHFGRRQGMPPVRVPNPLVVVVKDGEDPLRLGLATLRFLLLKDGPHRHAPAFLGLGKDELL